MDMTQGPSGSYWDGGCWEWQAWPGSRRIQVGGGEAAKGAELMILVVAPGRCCECVGGGSPRRRVARGDMEEAGATLLEQARRRGAEGRGQRGSGMSVGEEERRKGKGKGGDWGPGGAGRGWRPRCGPWDPPLL